MDTKRRRCFSVYGLTWVIFSCLLSTHVVWSQTDYKISDGSCASNFSASAAGGSLKYPISGNYKPGDGCSWIIETTDATKSIQVTLSNKDMEIGFDFLTIYSVDGVPLYCFSGQTISAADTVTLPFNQLELLFTSNGGTEFTGFELAYTFVSGLTTSMPDCPGSTTTNAAGGTVKYPASGNYKSGDGCSWTIRTTDTTKSIQLTLSSKDIEFGNDFLNIYTMSGLLLYRFTGQTVSADDTVTLPYNQLELFFASNSITEFTGFELSYTFVAGTTTAMPNCSSTFSSTAAGGSLKYPINGNYKRGDGCSWIIGTTDTTMSIQLTLSSKDIDFGYDFLTIYTMNAVPLYRFTGQSASAADTVTLPYNQLELFFTSDVAVELTGFQLSYTFVSGKTTLMPDCNSTVSSTAAGGSVKYPTSGNYKTGDGCSWAIGTTDATMAIQVTLTSKDIELGNDFLNIYTTTGELLYRFTGQTVSAADNITFPFHQLELFFTSNSATESTGFELAYTFVAVSDGWQQASDWTTCSASCGDGVMTRDRTCLSVVPIDVASHCSGNASETQACNLGACPVDGGWSAWASWTSCSTSCGDGLQTQSRTCDTPPPANNGANCTGNSSESQICNLAVCPTTVATTLGSTTTQNTASTAGPTTGPTTGLSTAPNTESSTASTLSSTTTSSTSSVALTIASATAETTPSSLTAGTASPTTSQSTEEGSKRVELSVGIRKSFKTSYQDERSQDYIDLDNDFWEWADRVLKNALSGIYSNISHWEFSGRSRSATALSKQLVKVIQPADELEVSAAASVTTLQPISADSVVRKIKDTILGDLAHFGDIKGSPVLLDTISAVLVSATTSAPTKKADYVGIIIGCSVCGAILVAVAVALVFVVARRRIGQPVHPIHLQTARRRHSQPVPRSFALS